MHNRSRESQKIKQQSWFRSVYFQRASDVDGIKVKVMKFCVINIFLLQVAIASIKFQHATYNAENAVISLVMKTPRPNVHFLTTSKSFKLDHVLENLSTEKVATINLRNRTSALRSQLVIIVIDAVATSRDLISSAITNVNDFYVILSHDHNQQQQLDVLQKIWNSRRISNINFMSAQQDEIILVTFQPFVDGYCGNNDKLYVINKFKANEWLTNTFFPVKLRNFHNCTLRLGTQPSFPAAERITFPNKTHGFIGSDVEISNELSRKFNFRNIFVHNDWWGSVFENGSGDGTIGKLITKEVDYICGWHFMNIFKSTFLDNSQPYFFVPFVIVVPPAAQYSSLENLIRCFQLSLWIASIFTCIFLLILIVALNYITAKTSEKMSYMIIIIIIFGGSTSRIPHESAIRMILMMFILFCLVMRTAYLTEMFNFLQSGTNKGVVESLEEMGQLKFSLHVPFFMEFFIPFNEIKYDRKRIKVSQDTGIERFINLDSSFKGGFLEPLDSVIRGYGKSSTPLNVLPQPLLTAPVAIYFQKNSFLRETFSNSIQQMLEAGLIEYWISQKWTSKMKGRSSEGDEPKVLAMSHLSAAFIICIVGLMLSMVAFMIEKYYFTKTSAVMPKKKNLFRARDEILLKRMNFLY